MRRRFALLLCIVVLVAACSTGDEETPPTPTSTAASSTATSSAIEPTPSAVDGAPSAVDTTPSMVAASPSAVTAATSVVEGHEMTVPSGTKLSVYAEGLGAPRFMAVDHAGVPYVADRAGGRVVRLEDVDGDGVADQTEVVLDRLNAPHSIAFHDGYLYVTETNQVIRARDDDSDGSYDNPEVVIPDLPTGGHWSRTIVFGPDGKLYLSVGSSCNACREEEPIRATVSRYDADGSNGEIISVGLRNAVGLAFDAHGQLWATNNGRDLLGDDVPPETLNLVTDGTDFGWPRCHSGDIPDPELAGDTGCQDVDQPAVRMQAHSAPLGLTFLDANALDGSFDGDALIAFHGSWNRSEPTGYKVVRVSFRDGVPSGEVTDFVTGFLLDDGESWGRPVDVLQLPDGSVLISDDSGGRIFRLSISGR